MTIREVDIRPTSEPAPKVGGYEKTGPPAKIDAALKKQHSRIFRAGKILCGCQVKRARRPHAPWTTSRIRLRAGRAPQRFPAKICRSRGGSSSRSDFPHPACAGGCPAGSRPLGDGDNAGGARGKADSAMFGFSRYPSGAPRAGASGRCQSFKIVQLCAVR
jgi:hypothetical protein